VRRAAGGGKPGGERGEVSELAQVNPEPEEAQLVQRQELAAGALGARGPMLRTLTEWCGPGTFFPPTPASAQE